MGQPVAQGLLLKVASCCLALLFSSSLWGQGYGEVYSGAAGAAWGKDPSATQDPSMLISPGGRPYRFRDQSSTVPDQGLSFRPDANLGQLPKNWGKEGTWASDPVLQQGLIFRPLDNSRGATTKPPVEAAPPVPPPYPYPPGSSYFDPWSEGGYYPAPVDPYIAPGTLY